MGLRESLVGILTEEQLQMLPGFDIGIDAARAIYAKLAADVCEY